jgi:nicotinic acid phosphoribosyltransferase
LSARNAAPDASVTSCSAGLMETAALPVISSTSIAAQSVRRVMAAASTLPSSSSFDSGGRS